MSCRPLDWAPPDLVQGRQVWLNQALPEHGMPGRPWPRVPADAFAALGHWGQMILVVPSWDLVVVRTADDRDGSLSRDEALARIGAMLGLEAP